MDTAAPESKPSPRATLDAARQALAYETSAGVAGLSALERYASAFDGIIQRLFADAPPPAHPAAIFALGGYGRRHLCLHSDIDLLLVFDGDIAGDDERFVRGMLHPLWDLKLVLGQQVRQLSDFSTLETDNPEFLLALLDARPLAGDRTLFDRFSTLFHQPAAHAFILNALEALITERHAQFNDTLYQLEPDVKDAPGALRDLTAVRTIARLSDPALLRHGPTDLARLDDAEDFLLRARSVIHQQARRNQNVLTHELQEGVAEALGYGGAQPRQRVERLMGDYFRHARAVYRSLEWIRRAAPVPVGVNIVRDRDGVRFLDERRAEHEPASWMGLFQAAIDHGTEVNADTLTWIQQHVTRFASDDFLEGAARRPDLLRLLTPRLGLYERLSEMHDCGLLGRMFPEFQTISSRVVRDFYHKYTVDEHTLLTIRNLERLTAPATASRARFGSLLAEVERPELLVLALLFHDVGKWRDDDHHLESVRMVHRVLQRIGMPSDATSLVEFLIHQHLQMSLVAFRRDTDDPDIVKRFADLVGTEERLKLLCLLTLVDVEAVSPETLTPWREELLWRLYIDTYNCLTLTYGDDLIEQDQSALAELLAGRPDDLSDGEIRRFLQGLPRRYLQLFTPAAIYQHVTLSRDITPDHVHATLEPRGAAWELTVVTLDKPALFANICGVLSSFGMDILRGHALTNPNGLVLDIFQFTDDERFLTLNADGRHQLLHELEEAVSGRMNVSTRLLARERGVSQRRGVPRFAPVIHCDNQSSRRFTILDIIANNAIGLLHRISRVISRHGCDVDLVLISTEGEKAIDVFHITQAGAKLSDEATRALTADLQQMLEGTGEAD